MPDHFAQKRVLVIEDEEVLGLSIVQSLKQMGFEHIVLKNSAEAAAELMEKLKDSFKLLVEGDISREDLIRAKDNHGFHLVVTDKKCPGKDDGLEFLQKYRGQFEAAVMYTSSTRDVIKHRLEGLKTGYLLKPMKSDEFKAAMFTALENSLLKGQSPS